MSDISLYNVLKKIDGVTEQEVKEAVADVASSKEVATKGDLAELKSELIAKIAEAKHTMIIWMIEPPLVA